MHIVSGFISGINGRVDRDLSKYVALGKELMACKIPMTIFLEKDVFDSHFLNLFDGEKRESGDFLYICQGGVLDGMRNKYSYSVFGHITIVFFEKTDMFLWPYQSMAHRFALNTGNPGKDTLGYMMVQCQKTEWVSIASSLHLFSFKMSEKCVTDCASFMRNGVKAEKMEEYIWMDFGIFHMFRGKIDVFQVELYRLRSRLAKRPNLGKEGKEGKGKITIARCMDPNRAFVGDLYKDISWLFAGSIFGGDCVSISRFALLMREKCFQVLREKNTLMWEINIWALIYKEVPDLFFLYSSDHSEIIARGYC